MSEFLTSEPRDIGLSKEDKQVIIQELRSHLTYDGKIPDQIVHTGEYKVRKAWFDAISWTIMDLEEAQVSPEIRELIESFKKRFRTPEWQDKELVMEDDIAFADQFCHRIVDYLSEG